MVQVAMLRALLLIGAVGACKAEGMVQGDRSTALSGMSYHPCSQPHCPLASFKHPDRPLEQLKDVMSNIKNKVGHLAARLDRKRRLQALRQLQAEMSLRRQLREQMLALGLQERVERRAAPAQQQTGPQQTQEVLTVYVDADMSVPSNGQQQRGYSQALKTQDRPPRQVRQYVTYGNWCVDWSMFVVKMLSVVLFQVVGTGLAIHEYQRTGYMTSTLMGFSSLLTGLAFVPPAVVALRHALPQHSRNPLIRGTSRLVEIALDVLVVSALSLLSSIVLTAVFAIPSFSYMAMRPALSDEYIVGALSAGFVFFFIWIFSRCFDPLAIKWFM